MNCSIARRRGFKCSQRALLFGIWERYEPFVDIRLKIFPSFQGWEEVSRYETRAEIGDLGSFGRHLPLSDAQPEFVLIYRGGCEWGLDRGISGPEFCYKMEK